LFTVFYINATNQPFLANQHSFLEWTWSCNSWLQQLPPSCQQEIRSSCWCHRRYWILWYVL